MHKLNSTDGERDLEVQQRLAEGSLACEGMRENGKHTLGQSPSAAGAPCSQRKMLVGLDVLCLFVASIPFFACELKAVKPYRRGFFCGDPTITYPYLENEAIPDSLLIAGGIIITGLTFYLQARLSWRGARLLRPLLQFLLVMLAMYTGLSRISDYRHHPSDVLTGFLQGALTAYWVAFHISSMFKACTSNASPTCLSLDSPLSMSSGQTVC
ncbi:hypothetical protein AOLI_G00317450 [Acnodon oligacanthus]